MSVESEILRIQRNVAEAYAAVSSKGGTVPTQPTSANLPAAISSIPTGGSSGGNPIGTIISYMGTSAPAGYLVCDGSVYHISDYPVLSAHISEQFGQAKYFGGNGTTTFAVPDMRNLFLRGYHGTAAALSGNIGAKQEGTIFPDMGATPSSSGKGGLYVGQPDPAVGNFPQNKDTSVGYGSTKTSRANGSYSLITDWLAGKTYTARPVNMAVLYCIKAVS